MATILHRLPDNARGKLFLVQLWDESGSQRRDIGASVLGVAEAKSRSQVSQSVYYRVTIIGEWYMYQDITYHEFDAMY